MSDLDAILKGEDVDEPEVTEEEAAASTDEAAETEAAESTDDAAKETDGEHSEPTGEEAKADDVSPASQEAEALKAELARIRQQNRDLKQKLETPAQPKEKPDFFADPDAALSQLQSEIQTTAQRVRIDTSEMFAREKHADYDEVIETFQSMAQENSALWAEMASQANPAEWAYKQAKTKQELAEIGDISSFKERLIAQAKAEARAELEKEMGDKYEAEIRKRLPKSLSDARSVSGNDDTDEDSLDELTKRA